MMVLMICLLPLRSTVAELHRPGAMSRALKELRGLVPFSWDARVDEHPAGEAAPPGKACGAGRSRCRAKLHMTWCTAEHDGDLIRFHRRIILLHVKFPVDIKTALQHVWWCFASAKPKPKPNP